MSLSKFSVVTNWQFLLVKKFLWMGFNWLKATEPLRGDILLFTIQFPGVPDTQIIDLRRMKD